MRIKILILVVISLFMLPTSSFSLNFEVKKAKATVRKAPNKSSKSIKELEEGAIVEYVKSKGNWFKVSLATGETGWILGSFIRVSKKSLAKGPAGNSSKKLSVRARSKINSKKSNLRTYLEVGKTFMEPGVDFGDIESRAVKNALEKIAGQANGTTIKGYSKLKQTSHNDDFQTNTIDTTATRVSAEIVSYKIVPNSEKIDNGIFRLKVAAVVKVEKKEKKILMLVKEFILENKDSLALKNKVEAILSSCPKVKVVVSNFGQENEIIENFDYEVTGRLCKATISLKQNSQKKLLSGLLGSKFSGGMHDQLRIYDVGVELKLVSRFNNKVTYCCGYGKYTENARNSQNGPAFLKAVDRSMEDLKKNLSAKF